MTNLEQRAPYSNEWTGDTIYQIYPRSFCERRRSGETLRGEGSLLGVCEKLGYLEELGVDAVWLSPFYPSPMEDGGYDVTDYKAVDPRYGTLADFDELVAGAHQRGIKVMIDLIPNHTSTKHPWFEASRRSDEEFKDFYIWRDPQPDGSPPNNWASVFSLPLLAARQRGELIVPDGEPTPYHPAWKLDTVRGQYYNHTFAPGQADLNWDNPDVRAAFKDVMRFWFDRGVDGVRIDAVNHFGKNNAEVLPDEQPNPDYIEGVHNPYDQLTKHHSANYPGTMSLYMRELISILEEDSYKARNLRIIFEAYVDPPLIREIDELSPRHASSFNFRRIEAPWKARTHKELLDSYHRMQPPDAIPNQVNGNHDKPRLASRLGPLAARVAAVVNLTLPGMIFIYNGEEGGFTDVEVPPELQDDRLGGRDPARTPMPWTPDGGFSEAATTWLPIDPDFARKNLEVQSRQPDSSLALYKKLLHVRRGSPTLRRGKYHGLDADRQDVLAFARRHNGNQVVTVANFSDAAVTARIGGAEQAVGRVILSSTMRGVSRLALLQEGVMLGANEAVVLVRGA